VRTATDFGQAENNTKPSQAIRATLETPKKKQRQGQIVSTPDPFTDNEALAGERPVTGRTGHIIIRLARRRTSDSGDLRELAGAEDFQNLRSYLATNDHLQAERVIRHADPQNIRERERIAFGGPFSPIDTLSAYWRIDLRGDPDPEAHRRALSTMPEIAIAYHETEVLNACPEVVSSELNTYESNQIYLDAAPQGIGASAAWKSGKCDGSGVAVIDIERAWIMNHEDLPAPQLLYGDSAAANSPTSLDHGAAVLGVIGGENNTQGIVGIAPSVDSLNVISHFDAAKDTSLHVADAIDAATKFLKPGDILLLEVQRHDGTNAYPVETDSADFHAIRHASAEGIIVIEAAGNGNTDLDAWVDPNGEHSLSLDSDKCRDSGAIMVGSAKSTLLADPDGTQGHKRYFTSNYGSRVDVYAWGEDIYTAGYGTAAGVAGAPDSYASGFGQTSGAAAIIAGAAALLQSWYTKVNGSPLSPEQMRSLLSNPATATPQVLKAGDAIGVMPDLDAIIANGLPVSAPQEHRLSAIGLVPRADGDPFAAYRKV
jgi:hypothetical protein